MQVLGRHHPGALFLINCGLLSKMELLAAERATAAKLIMEHEMGELFKVLALGAGDAWSPWGFARRPVAPALTAQAPMLRWLIVIFLALVFINGLSPLLQRLGLEPPAGRFQVQAVWARLVHSAGQHRAAQLCGQPDCQVGVRRVAGRPEHPHQ